MANLQYSSDIINYSLFSGFEPTDGTSDFESNMVEYLNRAYRTLYMGGTEFDPEINETWWWLKAESNLILQPSIKTGTVSVTNNSASITFSSGPTPTVAGYFFKVDNHEDVFKVSAHTATETGATLDSVYTGDTNTTASYRLMKMEYDLASDLYKIIAPMRGYQDSRHKIDGMSISEMEDQYPLSKAMSGTPDHFGMVDEDTVRFNRFGSDNGDLIRLDYDYLKIPTDLTDSGSEEPLVPLQYRQVLADITTFYLLLDKEDDKAQALGLSAKSGLKAMARENQSRWSQMGEPGQIYSRMKNTRQFRRVPRTESGLIL